ncbi:MAG: DUF5677 domain-containing protein [Reyranellales bacterium]
MSFNMRGFLSPDLDQWREKVRAGFPKRFAILDQVSDLGQLCLNEMCAPPRDKVNHTKNLLTCALLSRLLQLFQGSIINVERGMVTNARTLMRSGFETLFFFGASIFVEDFFTIAMQDHKHQQDKLLRMHIEAMRNDPEAAATIVALEKARAYVEEQLKEYEAKEAGFWNIAKMAGMTKVYDTYYRGLSTDSAHVNIWSLMNIFDAETGGIKIGPAVGDYEDTLNVTIVLGVTLVEVANHLIKSGEIAKAWRPLHDRAMELMPTKPIPDPPSLSDMGRAA